MTFNKKIFSIIIITFLLFNDAFSYYFNKLSYFDEIIVVILGILFLAHIVSNKNNHIRASFLILCTLLFSAIGITSFFLNSASFGSFSNAILSNFQMIKVFLLIFLTANLNLPSIFLDYMVYDLKFIGTINGLFIILQFFLYNKWTSLFPYQLVSETTRFFGIAGLQGLYYFPGVSGSIYLFTVIICYVQLKSTPNLKLLIEFLLFSVFALISMRAKIFVAFILVIFIVEICLPDAKNKIPKLVIGSIPIVLGILSILPFIFQQVLLYFNPINNGTARYLLQVNGKFLAHQYMPLGVGFGQFASEGAKTHYSQWYYTLGLNNVWGLTPDSPGFATDTWWPAILGETGYFGFIVYIIMLVTIILSLYRYYSRAILCNNLVVRKYSLIALLITIQLIIESSAYQVFVTSPQYIIWGLFVGVVLGSNTSIKDYKK